MAKATTNDTDENDELLWQPYYTIALLILILLLTNTGWGSEELANSISNVSADSSTSIASKAFDPAYYSDLFTILQNGLEINIILGIMLLVAFFILFRILFMTRYTMVAPATLLRDLHDDLQINDIECAERRAELDSSLLAKVILPGLRLHNSTPERARQAIESAGRRALGVIRKQIGYLSHIGVLSPMIGFLGTVLGLLDAFQVIAGEHTQATKNIMLSGAIGKAIVTTAVGLIVGIPCMAAYYLMLARLSRITDDLEVAAEDLSYTLTDSMDINKN